MLRRALTVTTAVAMLSLSMASETPEKTTCRLTISVVDFGGRPVSGAVVTVGHGNPNKENGMKATIYKTGTAGTVELDDLESLRYVVLVQKTGLASQKREIKIKCKEKGQKMKFVMR